MHRQESFSGLKQKAFPPFKAKGLAGSFPDVAEYDRALQLLDGASLRGRPVRAGDYADWAAEPQRWWHLDGTHHYDRKGEE